MTLYLKYRPKNLDELDEVSVSESLKKIVTGKNIPHAFLFAGPKGTGKTSAARILAKVLNCENPKGFDPCNKCKQCLTIESGNNLDVIEMDAASHRGIDDVRMLRDAVKLAPVASKKKIYIIDEVHMLTLEAGNALLKTLEEPPSHVVFILATTNPEKIIGTVRSRATLIQFNKAKPEEIVRSLKRVVQGEKIKIDEDSLKLIAEVADGSFRDAIKTLEQIVAEENHLNKEAIGKFLFKNRSEDLDKFANLIYQKELKNILEEVAALVSKGVNIDNFLESLLKKFRKALLSKVGVGEPEGQALSKEELINLIELLSEAYKDISTSPIEELPLELAMIEWCGEELKIGGNEDKSDESEEKIENPTPPKVLATAPTTETKTEEALKDVIMQVSEQIIKGDISVPDDAWQSILSMIKPVNASMEALLRAAKPVSYNGKCLTLGVYYKFHKERIEEAKHRKILEEIVAKVLQSPTKVTCVLVDPPPKRIVEEAKVEAVLTEGKDQDIIKVAEEIFSN